MPAFSINHYGRPPSSGKLDVWLIGDAGTTLKLPLAPRLTHDGLAPLYDIEARVGQKPLLSRSGFPLRTYSYQLVLIGRSPRGFLDPQVSVEHHLKVLRAMARTSQNVSWRNFGPSEGGLFKITALAVSDDRRKYGENSITSAVVDMTLTESSDAQLRVGPLTGGASTTPVVSVTPFVRPAASSVSDVQIVDSGARAQASGSYNATERTYTISAGDTLSGIAQRFLGNASRYREIADWNNITNPNLITVGQRLTLYRTGT